MVVAVVAVRITTDVHAGCENSTVICREKVVVAAAVILVVAVRVFVVDLGDVVVDVAIHHFHDLLYHDVFSSHGVIWSDV